MLYLLAQLFQRYLTEQEDELKFAYRADLRVSALSHQMMEFFLVTGRWVVNPLWRILLNACKMIGYLILWASSVLSLCCFADLYLARCTSGHVSRVMLVRHISLLSHLRIFMWLKLVSVRQCNEIRGRGSLREFCLNWKTLIGCSKFVSSAWCNVVIILF